MKPSADFITAYLHEIGVQTPLPPAFQPLAEATPAPIVTTPEPVIARPVVPEPAVEQTRPVEAPVIAPVVVHHNTTLAALREQVAACTACELSQRRNRTVFGCGDPAADLMFIGEAPGADEDRLGEPFVGRAGQLLNRMIATMGLSRDRVYIMNTIKCRPPWNRDPSGQEMAACRAYFDAQIHCVKPRWICVLGRVAAHHVLATDASLAALRGRWHHYQGIPVWVTYHPAYLLRTPTRKQEAWQDLQHLMATMRDANT